MKVILKFLLKEYKLVIGIVVMGFASAVLEGVGIAFIFPVIQGMSGAMDASLPFPFRLMVGAFTDMDIAERLRICAALIMGITIIKCITIYFGVLFSALLTLRSIREIRDKCVVHLMNLGPGYLSKKRGSDLLLIIAEYTEFSASGMVMYMANSVTTILTFLFLFSLVLMISWKLTLIAFILVIVTLLFMNRLQMLVIKIGEDIVRSKFNVNRTIMDIINGLKLIQLFNKEEKMFNIYKKENDIFSNDNKKMQILQGSISSFFEIIGFGILVIILFFGSFVFMKGNSLKIEGLLLFIVILLRIIAPAKVFNGMLGCILQRRPSLKALESFLSSLDKGNIKNGTIPLESFNDCIEFRNVSFSYSKQNNPLFKNLSFFIKAGQKVGIVGGSGEGKSTIIDLLLRFYDIDKGQIFIDGIDIRDIEIKSLRKNFGVVSQDTFIFHDTIKNNIAFGLEGATTDQVIRAAQKAHANDFIIKKPDGYLTILGDRGITVSGGERQRLSIARAIIGDPEILVFDEATSALDTTSEKIVQQALEDVSKDKTVISIAHRLSTLANYDKIIVLKDGVICEEGSHDELMQKNGVYRGLAKMQTLSTRNDEN